MSLLSLASPPSRSKLVALVSFGLCLGVPRLSVAQPKSAPEGFAVARFQPAPAGDRFLGVPSPFIASGPSPSGVSLHGMLLLDYAHDPLILRGQTSGREYGAIIGDQAILHFGATLALLRRFSLDLDLPAGFQAGDAPLVPGRPAVAFAQPSSFALGDIRLGARLSLLGGYHDPFQLALGAALFLPTGRKQAYLSDGLTRVKPQILVGGEIGRVVWAAAMGPEIRGRQRFLNVEIGPVISFGTGLGVLLDKSRTFQVGPEISGSVTIGNLQQRTTNVEALLSARGRFARAFEIAFGTGFGLTPGIGTPDFRAVALFARSPSQDAPPDRDHDRIADEDDACPDEPGAAHPARVQHGCPRAAAAAPPRDRDGDGIPDERDGCPNAAGVESRSPQKRGCPSLLDLDHDGVPDVVDACPDVAGTSSPDPSQNGCRRDRDADGIVDAEDACPDVAGDRDEARDKNGCPGDRDGDTIRDPEDACPEERGSPDADPEKNGCPKAIRVENDTIVLLTQVDFESGATTIRKASAPVLDELAAVLLEHPEFLRVEVQGHTDNRGEKARNIVLSQRRAEAVRAALTKRGILPERLSAKGYGSTRPIAANITSAGRQKNRRVELRVLEKHKRQR